MHLKDYALSPSSLGISTFPLTVKAQSWVSFASTPMSESLDYKSFFRIYWQYFTYFKIILFGLCKRYKFWIQGGQDSFIGETFDALFWAEFYWDDRSIFEDACYNEMEELLDLWDVRIIHYWNALLF